jgi:hypothetical protein
LHKQPLLDALEKILPQHTLGISEYNLLRILQQKPYQLFSSEGLSDPLLLFQTHFMLFNALYQLRDRWQKEQKANVDILVTHIRLLPYQKGQTGLSREDKLRAYYLDWQNFSNTDKYDVELLIKSFWELMSGGIKKRQQDPEAIRNAYKCLLLRYPSDFSQVKRQYRKLLHQYHPDKGGETVKTQNIEAAFSVLKIHLSSR